MQTDLGELVADDSLDMQQLPFHDFPTYATKVFFPSANTGHPVLSPPKVIDILHSSSFAYYGITVLACQNDCAPVKCITVTALHAKIVLHLIIAIMIAYTLHASVITHS